MEIIDDSNTPDPDKKRLMMDFAKYVLRDMDLRESTAFHDSDFAEEIANYQFAFTGKMRPLANG